jgi:hypothetical protein
MEGFGQLVAVNLGGKFREVPGVVSVPEENRFPFQNLFLGIVKKR